MRMRMWVAQDVAERAASRRRSRNAEGTLGLPDGFDIVSLGIENERLIARGPTKSRRPIVLRSQSNSRFIKCVHCCRAVGAECEMKLHRPCRCLPSCIPLPDPQPNWRVGTLQGHRPQQGLASNNDYAQRGKALHVKRYGDFRFVTFDA